MRINQVYRAVVFHPSNSQVYVLSWVDHHDEAYRWAERKQFVVHPATGALQMLSAETSEAALAAPAPAAPETGLFSQVKDKHLLRLGVPEELIGVVRGINSDAELEAAETRLPQEAYEALFMLASGFGVVHARAGRFDPEQYDTGGVGSRLHVYRTAAREGRADSLTRSAAGDFGILIWPTSAVCFGPPSGERVL